MRVPPLDLKQQYAGLKSEVLSEFSRLFDAGTFVLGPEVERFEKQIADYLQVKHAIGVTSGTDAIWASLKAIGVGPGDQVLTTPFTFFGTVSPILNAGAEPIFADISAGTYNIDPGHVEEILKKDTSRKIKALVPVHLYGQSANMDPLLSVSSKYGVPVIEDAAQAIGTRYRGKQVGGLGITGCFSFYPTKNLGCLGDGGLVTTNDSALAERLRLIRGHGAQNRYYHDIVGSNLRLDAIQAAVLRIFLPQLEDWILLRQHAAKYYDQKLNRLSQFLESPQTLSESTHTYHQYTVRVLKGSRDSLAKHLSENGIGSAVYYPVPCHLQKAVSHFGFKKGQFPVAESAAEQVISLPIFPGITREMQDTVLSALEAWIDRQ